MAIKIFIDQGHNPEGVNTGATGSGLLEADVVYDVGIKLAALLRQNPNFEVKLSRNNPDEILGTTNTTSLSERVNTANRWEADYFLSLHTNGFSNPRANGSEAFVFRKNSPAYFFAEAILESVVENMDMTDRGVKINPNLYVLRRTRMPAVLLELGFLSNPSDAEKLRNDTEGFANAIYEGILDYFGL